MNAITDLLKSLQTQAPQTFRALTLYPLTSGSEVAPDYLTLDEALQRNAAHVTEVANGGAVPELRFENRSAERILLLDGEELVGAKQNRVLNLSMLIAAGSETVIPVTCVERKRWSPVSHTFHSRGRNLFATARASKIEQVSQSLKDAGERSSDQMKVWLDVSETSACFRVSSSTESMGDIYEQQASRLSDYRRAFKTVPGQVGAVFAIGRRVIGVESFDAQATYQRLMDKLVSSYAIDAARIDSQPGQIAPSLDEVRAFLEKVQEAAITKYPAIGDGEDLRLEAPGVAGAALVDGVRVIHLSAFSRERSVNDD